jgi:hypothetical protein
MNDTNQTLTPLEVPTSPVMPAQTIEPVITPTSKGKPKLLGIALLTLLVLAGGAAAFMFAKPQSPVATPEPIATLPTPQPLFLTVANLEEPMPAADGELLVKGTTLPNTTVLIFSDVDQTAVDADRQGNFEETVMIPDEDAVVRLVAYGENGEEISSTFAVSEDADVLGKTDSKANENANSNAKEDKADKNPKVAEVNAQQAEKVTGKKDQESKATKAAATKKAEVSPSPKSKANLEKEVKTFVTAKKTVKKEEKLGALAIMKLSLGEGTSSAKLTKKTQVAKMVAKEASGGALLKRHAVSGVITSVDEDSITLAHQIQRDRIYMVYFNVNTVVSMKGTQASGSADLKVGMRVAAAGIPNESGLLASRIHVIPGKATGVFTKNPVATASGSPKPSTSASASAKPSGSPSASPTAKASASPTVKASASPKASPTTEPEAEE